jgi:hypothetical protein
MNIFVALLAVGIPLVVHGYISGATENECSSMTPLHGIDVQNTPSPYDITMDKKSIKAGETIVITIKGRTKDDNFKGLLVLAKVGDTPIGSFDVSSSANLIQTLNCGGSKNVNWTVRLFSLASISNHKFQNAVTHKKFANDIQQVSFKWTAPPSLKEKVIFFATVVKNFEVFWVAQKSEALNID